MAIKTFTTGEVLTASDTNTYLANSGLVYVAGGALSSTATNFAGCFTSEYRDYRIVIDQPATSAAGDMYIKFLFLTTGLATTASNYYWAYRGINSAGGSTDTANAGNAVAYTGWSSPGAGGTGGFSFDIYQPQLAKNTAVVGNVISLGSGAYISRSGGFAWDATDQFSGFQIVSASATTLSGNVSIYGYRKA
jgi:3D (Asp-Asp-Asp) domain-containing protein